MQIEHVDAVNDLEAILSVEGVDAIVVGCNDLSASVGLTGQTDHPEVTKMLDTIAQKASLSTIPLGVSLGYDPVNIRDWLDRGVQWISVGGDVAFLMGASRDALVETRKLRTDWEGKKNI